MIHTRNLNKVFCSEELETMALANVNIDINEGEYVSIAGPAGSGKSSLFNIIGLLDVPDGGEVFFMGRECSQLSTKERLRLRRGNIGYLFRDFNLVDELTVAENIELSLVYMNLSKRERLDRLERILSRYKLGHKRDSFPSQLTRLQQQTVSIARSMIFNCKVLLADEPTGNLDSSGGGEIMEMLARINEEGTTIVLFTGSMNEAQRAQRVIQLFDGHVVTDAVKKGL